MSIEIYNIETCMGKLYYSDLPFLSKEEKEEFNKIGSTGKNSNGEKSGYLSFLNGLGKGEFAIQMTKWDDGDFSEKYIIVRVI
jgi:hypothetical protein